MLWMIMVFLLQVSAVPQSVLQNQTTQAAQPQPAVEGAVLASAKTPTATGSKPVSGLGLRGLDPVLVNATILPRELPSLDDLVVPPPTVPYAAQPEAILPLTASSHTAAHATPFLVARDSPRTPRAWYALTAASHGAAFFDAWTTRRVIASGAGHEANPLFKPFANSGLLYPAVQVAPAALDYLGRRLTTNRRPWVRKMWWVPQAASTTFSLWGGAHNLGVYHRAQTGRPN